MEEIVPQESWPTDRPILSVVIPCFNYGEYVEEAVASIIDQTLQDFDLLVVDDGSTDRATTTVLQRLEEGGTSVHWQRNQGLPGARNAGIERTEGKYVCCLDADDMLEPTYLEKAVALLESRPDIGFAYPWVRRIGEGEGFWEAPSYRFTELIHRNLLNHPAVFRRKAWQESGGFWDGMREGYEDWEFWINLGAHGYQGARIPEPLFLYRKHGRSMIDEAVEKHEYLVARIRDRHSELYREDAAAEDIERGFRDRYADDPFLNLSRPGQYLEVEGEAAALLFGGENSEQIRRLEAAVGEMAEGGPLYLVLEAPSASLELPSDLSGRLFAYYLPDFLPERCWADFCINLVKTRNIDRLWLAGSRVGYLLRGAFSRK